MSACSPNCGWCGACTSGPRPNATCSECRADFWKGRDDVGDLCDDCCDRRDAHTSAYQLTLKEIA
jgi:hypothetical protein